MQGITVDPRKWNELFQRRRQLSDAYKRVFDTPDGQLILRHWIRTGYVLDPTYCPGDPHETAHREGTRRFVLSVLREVNINDAQLLKMIEEQYDG